MWSIGRVGQGKFGATQSIASAFELMWTECQDKYTGEIKRLAATLKDFQRQLTASNLLVKDAIAAVTCEQTRGKSLVGSGKALVRTLQAAIDTCERGMVTFREGEVGTYWELVEEERVLTAQVVASEKRFDSWLQRGSGSDGLGGAADASGVRRLTGMGDIDPRTGLKKKVTVKGSAIKSHNERLLDELEGVGVNGGQKRAVGKGDAADDEDELQRIKDVTAESNRFFASKPAGLGWPEADHKLFVKIFREHVKSTVSGDDKAPRKLEDVMQDWEFEEFFRVLQSYLPLVELEQGRKHVEGQLAADYYEFQKKKAVLDYAMLKEKRLAMEADASDKSAAERTVAQAEAKKRKQAAQLAERNKRTWRGLVALMMFSSWVFLFVLGGGGLFSLVSDFFPPFWAQLVRYCV